MHDADADVCLIGSVNSTYSCATSLVHISTTRISSVLYCTRYEVKCSTRLARFSGLYLLYSAAHEKLFKRFSRLKDSLKHVCRVVTGTIWVVPKGKFFKFSPHILVGSICVQLQVSERRLYALVGPRERFIAALCTAAAAAARLGIVVRTTRRIRRQRRRSLFKQPLLFKGLCFGMPLGNLFIHDANVFMVVPQPALANFFICDGSIQLIFGHLPAKLFTRWSNDWTYGPVENRRLAITARPPPLVVPSPFSCFCRTAIRANIRRREPHLLPHTLLIYVYEGFAKTHEYFRFPMLV